MTTRVELTSARSTVPESHAASRSAPLASHLYMLGATQADVYPDAPPLPLATRGEMRALK